MTFKLVAQEHLPLLRDEFFRTALITARKCKFAAPMQEVQKAWALLELGAAQLFYDAGNWAVLHASCKYPKTLFVRLAYAPHRYHEGLAAAKQVARENGMTTIRFGSPRPWGRAPLFTGWGTGDGYFEVQV